MIYWLISIKCQLMLGNCFQKGSKNTLNPRLSRTSPNHRRKKSSRRRYESIWDRKKCQNRSSKCWWQIFYLVRWPRSTRNCSRESTCSQPSPIKKWLGSQDSHRPIIRNSKDYNSISIKTIIKAIIITMYFDSF